MKSQFHGPSPKLPRRGGTRRAAGSRIGVGDRPGTGAGDLPQHLSDDVDLVGRVVGMGGDEAQRSLACAQGLDLALGSGGVGHWFLLRGTGTGRRPVKVSTAPAGVFDRRRMNSTRKL